MADCSQFPFGSPSCQTIQVIEPDSTRQVATVPAPGFDPSITEQGDVILSQGNGVVTVFFQTTKAGDYRFEYLYIDGLGIGAPEIIPLVPVNQTIYSFSVDLGGYPLQDGYILRWRVVVVSLIQTPGDMIDAPESIRLPLTTTPVFSATFVNPRSNILYGFSELRVENLIDLPGNQSPILAQVVAKTIVGFTVGLSPTPPNTNYYLVARTP
jgi:hypothetical protein